ncbi:hypothetical protein VFPFJ_00344 [Purpureocillium lilacinum]|uniref:Uncharacterized protein n=1 Tax=Purpureocillium lilacinum TaxID=33203 RepID=A0A179H7T6_PURLI|nr:hypothetical protein VFPFJ_00344 [Purpureocillium lilacinum]OAQ86275.1 hypothetical protein VFPBJ_00315 [Purpureocillium lilacinum]OAQ94235.1 hypothetical protein VFPFJ_00344 [Purpureocillium lilacinum]
MLSTSTKACRRLEGTGRPLGDRPSCSITKSNAGHRHRRASIKCTAAMSRAGAGASPLGW